MQPAAPVAPGSLIAGFRIERPLAAGRLGEVYEATQPSVGRSVALRLIGAENFPDSESLARFDRQQRDYAAFHHARLVPTYESGRWEGGRFVATRYVRGRTLQDHIDDGSIKTLDADLLEPVAGALRTAHDAGLAHGAINARNVMVDAQGAAFLTDFGLGRDGSAAADRADLAALEAEVGMATGSRQSRRRLVMLAAVLAGLGAVAVAVSFGTDGESEGGEEIAAPQAPARTSALGSDLAAGDVEPLGCSPEPGANTPACTLAQAELDGQSVVVPRPGVVRGWAIRDAQGEIALQVIGEQGGEPFIRGFTQYEDVTATAESFQANLPVEPGDRIGVSLGPGALAGARQAAGEPEILRWEGGLADVSEQPSEARSGLELLVRADIEYGARPEPPDALTGRLAQQAEAGKELERLVLNLPGKSSVQVAVVDVDGVIAVDLFAAGRRTYRIDVEDVDAGGTLTELRQNCGAHDAVCLRWANDGSGLTILHEYVLSRDGLSLSMIG